MAITLPNSNGSSPISADLMYQFYDNKAITPQIRSALQKREDEELKNSDNSKDKPSSPSSPSSESKFGPAARVNITDQIIRMNIANNSTKTGNDTKTEESSSKKPARYDALTEIRKRIAADDAKAKEEKDAKLKEIQDKIAAEEAAKKGEGAAGTGTP